MPAGGEQRSIKDEMAGAKFLRTQATVDPKKIGLWGGFGRKCRFLARTRAQAWLRSARNYKSHIMRLDQTESALCQVLWRRKDVLALDCVQP
jgi:hypothetical protein